MGAELRMTYRGRKLCRPRVLEAGSGVVTEPGTYRGRELWRPRLLEAGRRAVGAELRMSEAESSVRTAGHPSDVLTA